jgi:hypothetical protein
MSADVSRHYGLLSPAERLTLTLEAMARDDEEETSRLQGSCPRKSYTQADAQYADRLAMVFDIMALVCMDLRYMMGKLHVLEWTRDAHLSICSAHHITAALAFVDGVRCEKGLRQTEFFAGSDQPEGDEENPDETADHSPLLAYEERGRRMEAVQRRAEEFTKEGLAAFCHAVDGIAQDLVDSWAAFDRFSRERLGVSAEILLRAWGFPFLDELMETLKRHDELTPNVERVNELRNCIWTNWDRRFGG